MVLEVTSGVLATLRAEAAAAAPDECCGVLLGTAGRIEALLPAANIAADRRVRFEIDPAALIAAHRAARAGGAQVLGYYHSHPAGHPVPSATDCEHASGDGRAWAIVAGRGDGGWEIGWWHDAPGGFEPLPCREVAG